MYINYSNKILDFFSDICCVHGVSYLRNQGVETIYIKTVKVINPIKLEIFFLKDKIQYNNYDRKNSLLVLKLFGDCVVCKVDSFENFDLRTLNSDITRRLGDIKEIENFLKLRNCDD